jgi:hypothetical protein
MGIGSRDGRAFVGHTGSQQKARTALRLYPGSNQAGDPPLCIVVMSNSAQADPGAIAKGVEDMIRGP